MAICTYFVPKIVHGITYILLQVGWYIFSHIPFKLWVLIHNVKNLASVIPIKTEIMKCCENCYKYCRKQN